MKNMHHSRPQTWAIIGASRGIGLEFVRQLIALGHQVIATIRDPSKASELWQLAGTSPRPGSVWLYECDVTNELSITDFVSRLTRNQRGLTIDYLVCNAGVLRYPNRATEISFSDFAFHLHTNTIGPIITAQRLLGTGIPIGTIIFMSSDSGSATCFRDFEDGFGAYAASKAALNQMLRHMAAELKRKESKTVILAMHPGEVATDMANIDGGLEWDVEGIMTPDESVRKMLDVIPSKGIEDSGTFWTWEGKQYPW